MGTYLEMPVPRSVEVIRFIIEFEPKDTCSKMCNFRQIAAYFYKITHLKNKHLIMPFLIMSRLNVEAWYSAGTSLHGHACNLDADRFTTESRHTLRCACGCQRSNDTG